MRRILGIDPGANATGYGVVEGIGDRLVAGQFGVIRAKQGQPLADRLLSIFEGLRGVIEAQRPHECAIEDVFNSKNPRSSLILGHARGAGILAARSMGIPVFEYSPLEVKRAVVGYGRAEKQQVQVMVKLILGIDGRVAQDAADALAVAVCHLNTSYRGRL